MKELKGKGKSGGFATSREMSGGIVIFIARKYIRFATNNGISSALHIIGEGKRKKGKSSSRTATHGARYFDR